MKQLSTPRKTRNKMFIFGMYRISIVVTAIVLSLVVFNFLHSELRLLDYDGDNNACRNYCEIIKNADTHSKILREDLPSRLKSNPEICIHCFEKIEAQAAQICFYRADQHQIVRNSTEVYLFNQVFLI